MSGRKTHTEGDSCRSDVRVAESKAWFNQATADERREYLFKYYNIRFAETRVSGSLRVNLYDVTVPDPKTVKLPPIPAHFLRSHGNSPRGRSRSPRPVAPEAEVKGKGVLANPTQQASPYPHQAGITYNTVSSNRAPLRSASASPARSASRSAESSRRSKLPTLLQQSGASRVPSPPRPPSASAVDPMGKGRGVGTPLVAGPRAREASPGRGRAQQLELSRSRTPSRGAQASPGPQTAAGPGTSNPPRAPSNHSRRSSSSSSAASMTSNPVENAASANTAWLRQQLGKRQRAPSSSGSSVAL
jgi:hypothetical protein